MTRPAALATVMFAATLAACASAPPPGFEPITTPGQFVDRVAGRAITFPNGGVLIARPDGSFDGNFNGQTPVGSWTFTNGQLCRTVRLGEERFPEVCNRLESKPGTLRFFNPDGTLSTEATLG